MPAAMPEEFRGRAVVLVRGRGQAGGQALSLSPFEAAAPISYS